MSRRPLLHEQLTGSVIGAFYEVYKTLGFGYLESLYATALEWELRARGHRVAREMSVRVVYKNAELGMQRLDMVVNDVLIVEIKSAATLQKTASRQLYNYLRATNLEVGLLLHFGPEPQFFRVVCANETESRTP